MIALGDHVPECEGACAKPQDPDKEDNQQSHQILQYQYSTDFLTTGQVPFVMKAESMMILATLCYVKRDGYTLMVYRNKLRSF